MAIDRFLIAPLEEGLRTDLKAWQIPDQAFASLQNAYIFRGRLKKRVGSLYTGTAATGQLGSRLRVLLGTTDISGSYTGTPPNTAVPGSIWKIGQQFSIGSEIYTVKTTGVLQDMLSTGSGSGKFSTTDGKYAFQNAPALTAVYYYPCEPVMGLTQYEKGTIHNQTAYAFDTQFAYRYSGGSWIREGTMVLTGANHNFVWSYNWDGVEADDTALFTTNFNVDATIASPNGDSMYYYDGTNWTAWRPQFITSGTANANKIQTCRIIIPFKDRLLLLNTIESDSAGTVNAAYTNRVRFSGYLSPVDANAFKEPNQAAWVGGGWLDGPTEEDIVGAELIRDRCIVYFERSTWEIGYTGNDAVPFVWQQINTELGSESQFSNIPFDKFILNVGPNGIQSCNGINVDRIDDKIPDEVFNIRVKNQGMQRVAGIRDYYTEMVYWTYPTDDNVNALTYPNKMFVFNYKNGTWALNDDCITTFGYWEQQTDVTWSEVYTTWEETNQTWSSNVNAAQFRHVIAGNQHGYVTELSRETSSQVGNLSVSTVTYTAATQSVSLRVNDHSLAIGDYVKLENFNGSSLSGIYQIYDADTNNIIFNGILSDPGTYTGGGTIARVPYIEILSKEWNPYKKDGRDFQLLKIDFGVKQTNSGQVTVDSYPSHTNVVLGSNILDTTAYSLVPLEASQRLLWHQVYFNGEGDSVQIRIYMSDAQMKNALIAESDFTIEGLILYTQPTRVR